MRKLLAAALTLEAIVLAACGQGQASDTTAIIATSTRVAPTATATPSQIPHKELQQTLVEYYTESKGQRHYDSTVLDDLLVIRHYVLNPESRTAILFTVAYGLIEGLELSGDRLYLRIKPLPPQEDSSVENPYVAFMKKALPPPLIASKSAISQEFIAHRSPAAVLPVNFTGQFPLQAPVMPFNPFWMVAMVADNGMMGSAQTRFLMDNTTGETLTFVIEPLYEQKNGYVVQNVGIGLMEMAILDLKAPENKASMESAGMF